MPPVAFASLYEGLVAHGLIVPVGVQGAFGRGAVFEDVLERLNAAITRLAVTDGAEVYTFPRARRVARSASSAPRSSSWRSIFAGSKPPARAKASATPP